MFHFVGNLAAYEVGLVQAYCDGDLLHFAGHEQPVTAGQLDLWEVERAHDECPRYIRCDYVRLSAEIGRSAYDVIRAGVHLGDNCGMFAVGYQGRLEGYLVSYCNGIGRIAGIEPDPAPEDGRKGIPLRKAAQKKMAAGILYDHCLGFRECLSGLTGRDAGSKEIQPLLPGDNHDF